MTAKQQKKVKDILGWIAADARLVAHTAGEMERLLDRDDVNIPVADLEAIAKEFWALRERFLRLYYSLLGRPTAEELRRELGL